MAVARFVHEGGALLVLPACRRLDAETAVEFGAAVGAEARGRSRVTVSLADVEAVDCSGLAALVVILKQMPPGGELRLTDARAPVREMLEWTGLDALFPVDDDDDATEAVPAAEVVPAALTS